VERTSVRATNRAGVLLVCLVVACLLLAIGVDPGSGTATNLHPADDVASLVVGAHHAKTVPTPGLVLVGALLTALAALSVSALANPTTGAVQRWTAHPDGERVPWQLVPRAARAWRAPPLRSLI
jgi:hypothetical protein